MRAILDFEHKRRQTPLLKELLALPFMRTQTEPLEKTESMERHRAAGVVWRSKYQGLADAPLGEKLELKKIQEEALEVNAEEDHIDEVPKPTHRLRGKQPAVASFASEGLYQTPSAFIRHLVSQLPAKERLTRRQTLFMVKFAQFCDEAWEDEDKPPERRRVHHMLLLGAGGTGKTHVVQNLYSRQ